MRYTIIILIFFTIGFSSNGQNKYFEIYTDSSELKKQNDLLILDIEKKIKSVEPSFSFYGLTTEIPSTFMPGQYREKTK